MKKNISINISGIIFHIEEDGYETLRKYLDNISRYFASYEDSSEILADIEGRIAEIFLSKLNEGKQVITAEDVSTMTAIMGNVSDFRAAEEQDYMKDATDEEPVKKQSGPSTTPPPFTSSTRGLVRDQKRKILGGVCTGIAYSLNVDAVWVRLAFAVFTFAWGIGFLAYLILWIVLPASYDLEEVELPRKIFRNPENKVLGGVSGGIAAYFNLEIVLVRVLFIILTITGGLGLLIYIVLWVVLPEARTLTERMQMQGEPVTISNIESSYKKEQKDQANHPKDESAFTKIILFPFRVIGMILQGLGKILVPIIEVLRVAIGVFIVLIGISIGFGVLVSGAVTLGILSAGSTWIPEINSAGIPIEALTNAFPWWLGVAAFIASIIPAIFIILLGVSVIVRKIFFSSSIGWTMFVFFIVSVVLLGIGIPRIIWGFKEEGDYIVEKVYQPSGKMAYLKLEEAGLDEYPGLHLTIEGYSGNGITINEKYRSRGTSSLNAKENAQMIAYTYQVQDSIFRFNSNIAFKKGATFRGQDLHLTILIPYNYSFQIDPELARIADTYIDQYDSKNIYQMIQNKGITCISCPPPAEEEGEVIEDLTDFSELDINGIFDVRIYQGDEYSVSISGTEEEKEKYKIYRTGKTLVIDFEGKKKFNWDWNLEKVLDDEVRISITMRDLNRVEASGFGAIRFEEFTTNSFELDLKGPIQLKGELYAEETDLNAEVKSTIILSGKSNKLKAHLNLASQLDAFDLEVTDAFVDVRSASKAKVNVTGTLDLEEGIGSDVTYKGPPAAVNKNLKN